MADDRRYDKEFFEHLIDKVDWDALWHTFDNKSGNFGDALSHQVRTDRMIIALLLELNLNMATVIQLLANALPSVDNPTFRCPKCKEDVIPNALGYCPRCKTDLASIYPDKISVGKKVE